MDTISYMNDYKNCMQCTDEQLKEIMEFHTEECMQCSEEQIKRIHEIQNKNCICHKGQNEEEERKKRVEAITAFVMQFSSPMSICLSNFLSSDIKEPYGC